MLEKGPASPPRQMPQRQMVSSTIPEVPEGARMATPEEARALPTQPQPVPVFGTLNFAGGDAPTADEAVRTQQNAAATALAES